MSGLAASAINGSLGARSKISGRGLMGATETLLNKVKKNQNLNEEGSAVNSLSKPAASMGSNPNISMSDSYNSSASTPVFPPATQEKAAAVFGTNDQRQASTNGFKQEVKERIISDIGSL
tara:strand:- start:2943 stop:3302 length:360 start_codon:yes stop_codon:yes gene_type:complete